SIHFFPTACVQCQVPFNTISTTEFQPFVVSSSAAHIKLPAALLTKPSIFPKVLMASSTVYCTRSTSRTSISMHKICPSRCSISFLVASKRSNDLPVITTFAPSRSEEHTSELQSRFDLVCRLLL